MWQKDSHSHSRVEQTNATCNFNARGSRTDSSNLQVNLREGRLSSYPEPFAMESILIVISQLLVGYSTVFSHRIMGLDHKPEPYDVGLCNGLYRS